MSLVSVLTLFVIHILSKLKFDQPTFMLWTAQAGCTAAMPHNVVRVQGQCIMQKICQET
jgi:hypothetical protein